MATKVKFHKKSSSVSAPTSADNGVYFVKSAGVNSKFSIEIIDAGKKYLPNYITFAHPVASVTQTNINNWNTAFGWGNHALAGYLKPADILNLVPYTGANKAVDLNTQKLTIGGDFEKSNVSFEKSYLNNSVSNSTHFTRLTDVASFSRGNDPTTTSDCIVITLPIRKSTCWVMEVDIFSPSTSSIFSGEPTKLLISAYSRSNTVRSVTAISSADSVKSVSFCRDIDNNTIIIIRSNSSSNFDYGKVNITNFYHGVTYSSDLAVKTNYKVDVVVESSLTDLTTNGTITNEQFTRDSYLWNKGNFSQADLDNWNVAFNRGDFRDFGLGVNSSVNVDPSVGAGIRSGLYGSLTSAGGSPLNGFSGAFIHLRSPASNYYWTQLWMLGNGDGNPRAFISHGNGTKRIADWVELYHTGNFNPAQYVLQTSLNTQLANYVPINGVTTINNTKTFTSSPIVPNATLDGHAVNLGQLNSLLPTVNDGKLTLTTGAGLSGSANFTANQSGGSTFSVAVASTHKLPTTAEWNALPTTNTITRLRGTASGTYTSGDLTLLAGANTTITQSGTNITIESTNTNTTYSAGNGLTLSGTVFSITKATATGSGNVVSDYNVTSTGIQLVKGITAMETGHVANGITSTLITNWNTAFTNNHTHSNKSNLDTINQNLGKTSDVSFRSINSNNITVLGSTFNMLELKQTINNGSSIAYSNSEGKLGEIGFTLNGDLIIGKGSTSVGNGDLLSISSSTGLPRFNGLSGSGSRIASITANGTLDPITPTIDYILGVGNSTTRNIKFTGEGSIISEANGTKLNMLAHQNYLIGVSTGILTIKHPTVASATIFDVVIKVYGYNSKYMGEYRIAFYQYSATSIHASTGICGYITGTDNLPSKVVKVGLDADGKISIMIGDATTSWNSYLSYTLERVKTKHLGWNKASWDNGWTSEIVTDITGYTNIVTIPMTDIANNYELPIASASVLGGVKVGTNLSINASGVLSATDTNTTYSAGTGLSLTGTTFANTAPNATHTGDVTGATALTITNNAVTHAKYQNIATQRILGRGATGTGNVQELTLGANLTLSTTGVLSATNTNTTYSAGNGLTLSGTAFSLPVVTSGSGNVVSAVAQSTNGITVTKGNSVPLQASTGGDTNSIRVLDTRSTNPAPSTNLKNGTWFDFKTTSAIGLTISGVSTYASVMTMVPYADVSGNNNTAFRLAQSNNGLYFQQALTSKIGGWDNWKSVVDGGIDNIVGGNNPFGDVNWRMQINSSNQATLTDVFVHRNSSFIIGSNSNRFEAIALKTVFGSLDLDDEGLNYRPSTQYHAFTIESNVNAHYDIELHGKLNNLKINGRSSLGSPADALIGNKLSNYVFGDVSNKNALGTFRVESNIIKDGGIPVFARWGASILVQTSDTMFTLSANPNTPEIFVSAGNTTNNILWNKKLAFSVNEFTITATAFYESSLKKFKTNIKPFNKSGIELINSLDIVTFDRIDDKTKNKIGVIADDTSEEFLSEDKDAVDLYKTSFIQAKAIQELSDENNKLKERLKKIEDLLNL